MRSFLTSICVAAAVAAPSVAFAQGEPATVKEIDAIAHWLTAKSNVKCTEKCFVLSKLLLGGDVETGALTFRLEGTNLAGHPVAVPLFGTPTTVRVEEVLEGDKAAAVGFEGDHYFVMTKGGEGGRFVVTGKLFLDTDRALTIPGPLNALAASFTKGRLVEGEKLSGLSQTTVHFDFDKPTSAKVEAPMFQISRALRVQRETTFEYRLVLKSGADLGVVRLPLHLGEKVLEVAGAQGWKVEGTDLVLPTAGKSATITVTGTLADAQKTLVPDPRASFEWWLVESDAEHRVTPKVEPGAASQLDSAESPLPRTQPTSRLFLAKKGQHLSLSVQNLAVVEALGAVVRDHHRTVVLTARGDVVGDESFQYENNGLDHLPLFPAGKPVFQATDGVGERIMRRDPALAEILLPLRKGVHHGRVQTVSAVKWGTFGGTLSFDPSAMPLTASRTTLQIGLPEDVHPIVALGGDRAQWFVGLRGFFALAIAAVASALAFGRPRDRLLFTLALGGLGFVSLPLFTVATGGTLLVVLGRFLVRTLDGKQRTRALGGLALAGALTTIVAVAASSSSSRNFGPMLETEASGDRKNAHYRPTVDAPRPTPTAAASAGGYGMKSLEDDKKKDGKEVNEKDVSTGNFATNQYADAIVQGVQPVALPLPSAARWITVSRELVPKDRPLAVRVHYVTTTALLPVGALWLGCWALLLFVHRDRIRALVAGVRERLAAKPTAPVPPAPAE